MRLRRSADFRETVRRGGRAGSTTVVLHCHVVPGQMGARVGMVVARSVGGAVVRNKVRRRLRGVVVDERMCLPDGADLVVRALPAAAQATYGQLNSDFHGALRAVLVRTRKRTSGRTT